MFIVPELNPSENVTRCLVDSLIHCFVGDADSNDYTSEGVYIPNRRSSGVEKRIIKDG